LKAITPLRNLTSLQLTGTKITDAGVPHLLALPKLAGLHLANTGITKNSLPVIAKMRRLRHQDLSGTDVGDDLAPLAALQELDWLLLEGLPVSDQSEEIIASLAKLRRLTLTPGQASKQAIDQLGQKPDLFIDLRQPR
jgi:hypothetical protein